MQDLFPEGAAGGSGVGETEGHWGEAEKEAGGEAAESATAERSGGAEGAGVEGAGTGEVAEGAAAESAQEAGATEGGAEAGSGSSAGSGQGPEGAGSSASELERLVWTLAAALPRISVDTERYGEVSQHMMSALDDGRRRRTWLMPAALACVALACMGAGAGGYAMLAPEDPDRAWKDYLWDRYGGEFEACVRQAVTKETPVDCTFTFQPE